MEIAGTKAVVTGAASGLGRAAACELVARGAEVIGLDVNGTAGAGPDGCDFPILTADVADGASVESAFAQIEERFGTLDICVNAAGVATAASMLSEKRPMSREVFERVIAINLVGAFDVMRRSAQLMATGDGEVPDGERGVIINVSSGAAFQGQRGQTAYSASKAGLIGLMLPAARELGGRGIRVLSIAPGLFMTPMAAGLPQETIDGLAASMVFPKRLGSPEDFAHLVRMLIENPYLNAETISIDAGVRMT
jgi:3-hydroxyacyl-CoA dehydrogenase/3-hydroxy-2-methylbutyryl-CoA dehydrogenase